MNVWGKDQKLVCNKACLIGFHNINPALRLKILNVSESYLSGATIDQLRSLDIEVIADEQREEEDDDDPAYRRYCVVSE